VITSIAHREGAGRASGLLLGLFAAVLGIVFPGGGGEATAAIQWVVLESTPEFVRLRVTVAGERVIAMQGQ
jgi:hypothetical protein